MTTPNPDLMSEHMRKLYELGGAPNDPFRYDEKHRRAVVFRRLVDDVLPKVAWRKGRIKAGHGSLEDGDCFVTWINYCPLTVLADPQASRKYQEEGQPIFGYSYRFIVGGHCSGSSNTLAGAIQEAAMTALDADRLGSDSKWLSKGGKNGFLAEMQADLTGEGLHLSDFMIEEFMTPTPVLEGPYATVEASGVTP